MKLKNTFILLLLLLTGLSAVAQLKKKDMREWFVGHRQSKTVFKAAGNVVAVSGRTDILTLGGFSPKPASVGLWKQPCGNVPPLTLGINGLEGYFNDANDIVKKAQDIKANAGAYKEELEQMMGQARQLQSQMNSAGGGMNSPAGAAAPVNLANMGRLVIPVTIRNSAIMIDQTLNAKQSDTQARLNQLIEYGTLQIQLKQKSQY